MMASAPACWASTLARLSAASSSSYSTATTAISFPTTASISPSSKIPRAAAPSSRPPLSVAHQARTAAGVAAAAGYRGSRQLSEKERLQRRKADDAKRKAKREYHCPQLDDYPKFSLCDAMRFLRAVEVGQPPKSVKYELFVRMRTYRSGPVVKNRVKLPHPIQGDERVAVICPENSAAAAEAIAAGAVLVGEDSLFKAIRAGELNFTKLICHASSEPALNKANLGRILGPKGLMPNKKNGTITTSLKSMMKDMVGAIDYRERNGVVRLVVGQLNHSPRQLSENLSLVMRQVKSAIKKINVQSPKSLHEVVLSSTHGPGISLNGLFNPTDESLSPEDLAGSM